jgi:hypothetical protein
LKNRISTYLICLLFISAKAQLINNNPVDITVGPTTFNTAFIKQQKIQSIKIIMVDKPDGAVIIDKGSTQGYEFDTEGRVVRYYYTILKNIEREEVEVPAIIKRGKVIRQATTKTVTRYINDTVFATILYNAESKIIAKRIKTNDYYDTYYYEYNAEGKIQKELHCKETNVSENKNEFKLGVQTILSVETFEYIKLSKTQTQKKCLNDEGREYKKVIINYDDAGNIISENYNYIVSWMFKENNFEYDFADRVIKHTTTSNESGDVKTQKTYEYNNAGVLQAEKYFKNNELINETTYLYDENSPLIYSRLVRDHKNASIGIVKFIYSFY